MIRRVNFNSPLYLALAQAYTRIVTSSSFRVVLGPMAYDDFRGFLPGETAGARLARAAG